MMRLNDGDEEAFLIQPQHVVAVSKNPEAQRWCVSRSPLRESKASRILWERVLDWCLVSSSLYSSFLHQGFLASISPQFLSPLTQRVLHACSSCGLSLAHIPCSFLHLPGGSCSGLPT